MTRSVFAAAVFVLCQGCQADDGLAFEGAGRTCIAMAVFAEARGEPVEGQIAVAQVIRNRIDDDRWASDPCQVVAELDQFHGFRDWPRPRHPRDIDANAWEIALIVTDGVMLYGWESGCDHATHFWRGPTPAWAHGADVCPLGNHLFAAVTP